ncbi:MAG: ABC transporter permease [Faecousia sp.]
MKRVIRTYLPFTLNQIKSSLAYRWNAMLWFFIGLFQPFITYYLWQAIYGSSAGAVLGGLTRDEMTVYVFLSHVVASAAMISIDDLMADDVEDGRVIMNLIKPIDYRASLISRALGEMLFSLVCPGIFLLVGIELYKGFVLGMGFIQAGRLLLFALSMFLSFLVYVLFDFCFGLVAFVTTYFLGLFLIRSAVLSFLTGQLIPLTFFPEVVQRIFRLLPFSSMVYTPVMIYLGKLQGREMVLALATQAVWVVLLYLLGSFCWKRITKRLVVLGG